MTEQIIEPPQEPDVVPAVFTLKIKGFQPQEKKN